MTIVPASATRSAECLPDGTSFHPLRSACRCGHLMGYIRRKGAQDCVYCQSCGAWQYNAPRTETGTAVRPVRSRPEVSPSQRSRIMRRDGYRCVLCGAPASADVELHLAHLVSVLDGPDLGLSESDVWHDENLIVSCAECNLGLGKNSVPARLIAALVVRRAVA